MSLPVAQPLERVSPSAFGDLTACQLRMAFKQQADGAAPKTDAQVIGDALHAALAGFIDAREYELPDALPLASARFAAQLEQQATGREVGGARPAAARLAKIIGRVLQLLEEAGPEAVTLSETYLRAREGKLHGVVDLIIESIELHAIVDYKTGRTTDEDGEVSEHFRTQVQFYAVLEEERSGTWPQRGVLLRFGGPPIPVDVDPARCAETADRALAALGAYNALAGQVPRASPGEVSCRFCAFAPLCPSFWEALTPSWSRGAVRGRVAWMEASATGGMTIGLEDASGSYEGKVAVRRVPQEALAGKALTIGTELRICGVHADTAGRLLPDRFSRTAVYGPV